MIFLKITSSCGHHTVCSKPRKTRPFITERLLIGRKESNQTNKKRVCSAGCKNLCNFGKRHYVEYSCEIILNFGQWTFKVYGQTTDEDRSQ